VGVARLQVPKVIEDARMIEKVTKMTILRGLKLRSLTLLGC